MTLNEAVQVIEKKIGSPVSLKMLITLFEDDIIIVNKKTFDLA
jgi:hypothetical protein